MKKCKKLLAFTLSVLLAFACYVVPAFASSSASQYGLEATLVTDKESYKANEEIHVTVTVKNTNDFKVEAVSIESLLPETLTLKDGSNSTKTVDLEPGETLTLSFTAVKEKEETSATEPESQSTEPTETEPVLPSESETVKPSETETVKPSESETVKPSETETQKPTQESTEQPTQGMTTPITTEPTAPATTTEGTTLAPSTTGTQPTTGGIIGDLATTFPKTTTPADSSTTAQAENPDTGDSMSVKTLAIAIIALFSVIAIVIILMYKYKKQTTKMISLVMCVAISASAITGVTFFTAKGVDNNRESFTVEKVITVDGEETNVGAEVKYSDGMLDDKKVEEELSKIKNLNNGELPDINMSEKYDIPSFIHGKYTNKIIKNGQDAINSLQDIKHLMKIKEPATEFKSISEDSVNEINFYRLQQYYRGIEVNGAQLIITTNKEGIAQSVNGSYYPNNINTEKSISPEEVENIVINNFEKDAYVSGSPRLIYSMNNKMEEYILAYKVIGGGIKDGKFISGFFIISAQNGEILEFDSLERAEESVSSSGIDNLGNRRNFWTEKISDDLYFLADFSKNISVYDAGNNQISWKLINNENEPPTLEIHWERVWLQMDSWFTKAKVVQSKNNQWKDKNAVTLFANLCDVYDFYYKELDRCGFDGKNGEVFAIFNDNHEGDWTNARSTNHKELDMTLLAFGRSNKLSLDTVSHEYTHSVLGSIVSLDYKGESGAISEAYADIMGEIIENDSSWTNEARKISSPRDNEHPDYYKGVYWIDTNDMNDDKGGIHNNSTVISHAAFLMNQKGIHMNELAKIFYTSMFYLPSNANFNDCRESVIQAVKNVNKDNINIVKTSFGEVGIFSNMNGKAKVRARFIDGETKEPVQTEVLIHKDNRYGELYDDYTYVTPEGNLYLELPSGKYVLEVQAKDYVTRYIDIDCQLNSNISLGDLEIYKTSFIPNPDPTPGIDDNFAGGDGSKENPYQIATAAQLNAVRNHMDSHFVLINDIDLSKYNWEPIGGIKDVEAKDGYRGTFDGQNHAISGLTICYNIENNSIDKDETYFFGLFSNVDYLSIIKNVVFHGVNIRINNDRKYSEVNIATISANGGIIDNCITSGNIIFNTNKYCHPKISGVANLIDKANNCTNSININFMDSCMDDFQYIKLSGICSSRISSSDFIIENCINTGNIICQTKKAGPILAGGITCGMWSGKEVGNYEQKIKNSINYGNIEVINSEDDITYEEIYLGGIVGEAGNGVIEHCANYGNIICKATMPKELPYYTVYIGGIVGQVATSYSEYKPKVYINNCLNYGDLSGTAKNSDGTDHRSFVGGILGKHRSPNNYPEEFLYISNCYNACNSIYGTIDSSFRYLQVSAIAAADSKCLYNNYFIDTLTFPIQYGSHHATRLSRLEIEKAIQELGFELPGELPAAS